MNRRDFIKGTALFFAMLGIDKGEAIRTMTRVLAPHTKSKDRATLPPLPKSGADECLIDCPIWTGPDLELHLVSDDLRVFKYKPRISSGGEMSVTISPFGDIALIEKIRLIQDKIFVLKEWDLRERFSSYYWLSHGDTLEINNMWLYET